MHIRAVAWHEERFKTLSNSLELSTRRHRRILARGEALLGERQRCSERLFPTQAQDQDRSPDVDGRADAHVSRVGKG